MSLDRAYINCERCHSLAYTEKNSGFHTVGNKGKLADKVYEIRNDAMNALEETDRLAVEVCKLTGIELPKSYAPLVTKALRACRDCDYTQANIVNIIKKEENKK